MVLLILRFSENWTSGKNLCESGLVFMKKEDFRDVAALSRPQDGGILYVASKGRSGTTLFGMVCGLIDEHIFVGDLKTVWDEGVRRNYLCGCGVPFHECPFWSAVIRHAYGSAEACLALNLHEAYDRVIRRATFRDVIDHNRRTPELERDIISLQAEFGRLHNSIRHVSGKKWIVDTSKHPSCAYVLSALYRPSQFKLIHLVRDPRGVAYSRKRVKMRPETGDLSVHLNRSNMLKSTRRWVERNCDIERLSKMIPVQLIRYESFVADPLAVLKQLVSPGDAANAFERLQQAGNERPIAHSIAGNPHRYSKSGLVLRLDQEWEKKLKLVDRLLVRLIAGSMISRYGY
jgi:hypothetical protein